MSTTKVKDSVLIDVNNRLSYINYCLEAIIKADNATKQDVNYVKKLVDVVESITYSVVESIDD